MTDQTFPPFELPKPEAPKKRRGPKPGKKRAIPFTGINQRSSAKFTDGTIPFAVAAEPDTTVILAMVKILDALDRNRASEVMKVLARIYE